MRITINELWKIVVSQALLHDGVKKTDLYDILSTDDYDVDFIEVLKNEKIPSHNRVCIFIEFMYNKDRTLCENWAKKIVDRVITRHVLTYPNKDVQRWGFWHLFSDIYDTLKSNQNSTNLNAIAPILSNEEIKNISKQSGKDYFEYAIESITLFDRLSKNEGNIDPTILMSISDCAALAAINISDDFLYEILGEEIYKFIQNNNKNYNLYKKLRDAVFDDGKINQLNNAICILLDKENNKLDKTPETTQFKQ